MHGFIISPGFLLFQKVAHNLNIVDHASGIVQNSRKSGPPMLLPILHVPCICSFFKFYIFLYLSSWCIVQLLALCGHSSSVMSELMMQHSNSIGSCQWCCWKSKLCCCCLWFHWKSKMCSCCCQRCSCWKSKMDFSWTCPLDALYSCFLRHVVILFGDVRLDVAALK